jgi:hypothetical protein
MTDDEKEARQTLFAMYRGEFGLELVEPARTILSRLDEPRLPKPEDVPLEVLDAMFSAFARTYQRTNRDDVLAALRVHYDHYTKPPAPKRVEAWAVMFDNKKYRTEVWGSQKKAEERAAEFNSRKKNSDTQARIVHLVEVRDDQ